MQWNHENIALLERGGLSRKISSRSTPHAVLCLTGYNCDGVNPAY